MIGVEMHHLVGTLEPLERPPDPLKPPLMLLRNREEKQSQQILERGYSRLLARRLPTQIERG